MGAGGTPRRPHERVRPIEEYFAGRVTPEETARARRECAATGAGLHDALMDRIGWPSIAHDVANFVLSLSGHDVPADKVARGKQLFTGEGGGCYYCHTEQGTGLKSQGAANLTDNIWTIADVQGQAEMAGKIDVVKAVIRNGVNRVMPTWQGRLDETQIKLLTVYVHQLGEVSKCVLSS